MTAEHLKVFNAFNELIVGKDRGTESGDNFRRLADYSYVAAEQYERNFGAISNRKNPLGSVCGKSELCEDRELLASARQAAERKTLGNRKRKGKFINPPKHEYDESFLSAVIARKSRLDNCRQSFDGVLAKFEALEQAKAREKAKQEQIAQAERKRIQRERQAEEERKMRQVRLHQAIEEENNPKGKEKIKRILGAVGGVVVILLGILYIIIDLF